MDTWTIVGVVLVAVLVGASLPVLLELFRTLREARRVLRNLDAGLQPAIRELEGAARHARRMGDALEPHLDAVAEAVGSLASVARPLREIRARLVSLANLLAALVPALVAALRAYRAASGDRDGSETTGADVESRSANSDDGGSSDFTPATVTSGESRQP